MKGRHTNAPACGKHVGGPLLSAASGGIEVSAPREFHSGESVDDNHRSTAVGAVPSGGSFRGSIGRRPIARQQLPAEREGMRPESIREKTKIPDSHESLRQHVQEEAAQELSSQQRHRALLAAVSIVLPSEGDAFAIECEEPMIGDGDPVRISAEIAQDLLWATEGRFGVDHPVLAVQLSQKSTELFWISQRGGWSGAA